MAILCIKGTTIVGYMHMITFQSEISGILLYCYNNSAIIIPEISLCYNLLWKSVTTLEIRNLVLHCNSTLISLPPCVVVRASGSGSPFGDFSAP